MGNLVVSIRRDDGEVIVSHSLDLAVARFGRLRPPEVDVPLSSPRASRRHFDIHRTEEGCFILDKSSNGTTVNGRIIPRDTMVPLFNGDRIGAGGLIVQIDGGAQDPPAPDFTITEHTSVLDEAKDISFDAKSGIFVKSNPRLDPFFVRFCEEMTAALAEKTGLASDDFDFSLTLRPEVEGVRRKYFFTHRLAKVVYYVVVDCSHVPPVCVEVDELDIGLPRKEP